MIYVGTTNEGIIEFRQWSEVRRYAEKKMIELKQI